MKILVTGAKGFVGKNLIASLNNIRLGLDQTRDIPKDLTISILHRNYWIFTAGIVILCTIWQESTGRRIRKNLCRETLDLLPCFLTF